MFKIRYGLFLQRHFDGKNSLWFIIQIKLEPLVSKDQLLEDGVVVRVGLVVHDPTASHDLELAVCHQAFDLLLDFESLLGPPHGEERYLCPDELSARIDGQFLDHVGQDLTGLRRVVLIKGFDPS